jgi:heme/copper-type cytochrome/quinol oxidase subunit 2
MEKTKPEKKRDGTMLFGLMKLKDESQAEQYRGLVLILFTLFIFVFLLPTVTLVIAAKFLGY